MENEIIRVKAMCLLIDGDRVLVGDGATLMGTNRHVVPSNFFRVLGGSINFRETAEQAVRREVQEEIGSGIVDLQFLGVVENLFFYAGEDKHEVVFLYKGALENKELLNKETVHISDRDYEFDAVWIKISDILNGAKLLYPETDYKKFFEIE